MKIIRRPRPYPPSDIKKEDLKKATKNGVVDLSKIRSSKEKRREERIKKSAMMHRALSRKRSIAKHFTDLYTENIGGKYDLRPSRYVTRKVTKNTAKRITINSDMERLWVIFQYIQTRYKGSVGDYKEYLNHIFSEIMEIDKMSKKSIIGFIEKQERIDDYFFEARRRRKRVNDVRRRTEEHSEYFDDE